MRHVEKFLKQPPFIFGVVLTGFIFAGQLQSYPAPVRDIINGNFVEGLTVHYPVIYTLFAPVFQIADRVTILSIRQLLIFMIYINVVWVVWRAIALFSKGVKIRAVFAEIVRFIGINAFVLLCIFLFILVPRPLLTVEVSDPEVMVLDFHTHTNRSWDVRQTATLSKQIQFRRSGGFDAFFVTNHNSRYSALETNAATAAIAGSTIPIPFRGEEISQSSFNLIVLGPDVENPDTDSPELNKARNPLLKNRDNSETLVIATVDVDWWKHPEILDPFVLAGLNGIELAKSSPKGLDLTVEDRERMVRYARKNNLIITGASDNHGFGSTDYVWNLLRLPGWRTMKPAELERAVLLEIRKLRPGALTIVTRIKAEPTRNAFLMGIDPLRQIWEMLRSIPWVQSALFVVYAWIPFFFKLSWGILKPILSGRKSSTVLPVNKT